MPIVKTLTQKQFKTRKIADPRMNYAHCRACRWSQPGFSARRWRKRQPGNVERNNHDKVCDNIGVNNGRALGMGKPQFQIERQRMDNPCRHRTANRGRISWPAGGLCFGALARLERPERYRAGLRGIASGDDVDSPEGHAGRSRANLAGSSVAHPIPKQLFELHADDHCGKMRQGARHTLVRIFRRRLRHNWVEQATRRPERHTTICCLRRCVENGQPKNVVPRPSHIDGFPRSWLIAMKYPR
jgi:hypothetical protein